MGADSEDVRGPGTGAATSRPLPRRAQGDRCKLEAATLQTSRRSTRMEAKVKGHAAPYSRYTAPDIAPRSVLTSEITRLMAFSA